MTARFDLRERAQSFVFAARGVHALLAHEHNARIHLAATVAVLSLAALLRVGLHDWMLLALAVAIVWIAEAANSAIETLADAIHPDDHALIGRAKDMGAGGVLIAAVVAAGIGFSVLGPPLWRVLTGG